MRVYNTADLIAEVNDFINEIDKLEVEQKAILNSKKILEETILNLIKENEKNEEALDIAKNAIKILRAVSDKTVKKAYKYLEESLNLALSRMFIHTTRRIKLQESTRGGKYPQLEIQIMVSNGKTRSLKSDSGHGLAQIVSILSILCLIVLTGRRRVLVMDEVLSGLSVQNRKIIDSILWTFTEIGFQFIINEHGFVPKGAKVYKLKMEGDVAGIEDSYIESSGVYLNDDGNVYNNTDSSEDITEFNGNGDDTNDSDGRFNTIKGNNRSISDGEESLDDILDI